jgi:hypothetical protein
MREIKVVHCADCKVPNSISHRPPYPDICRKAVRTLSAGRMRHVIQYSPLSYQANRKGWSSFSIGLAQCLLECAAVLSLTNHAPPRNPTYPTSDRKGNSLKTKDNMSDQGQTLWPV